MGICPLSPTAVSRTTIREPVLAWAGATTPCRLYKFTATTNMIEHVDGKDLQEAKNWAYNLIHSDNKFFILDTETTGLGDAEIVDVCVMTQWGQPLINTLVKPTIPIPSGATHIHHITDEMVADAPTFPDIY
ncbi:MAG: 3'-5' exonuclease, partial [Nostoc sp.]